jgi:hypothetical protein
MSDNDPSNPNDQIEIHQHENANFIQNEDISSPYIKQVSYSDGIRTIKIIAFKGIYYALIIFAVLELIQIIISFTLLRNIAVLQWFLILLNVPFIILFLFIPVNAICKYDYNQRRFSSYITPIIPIPYCFYKNDISFEDISFFYLFKINKCRKKYYKIGINKKDGEDEDIALGQDHVVSTNYDENLNKIPRILKSYLRQ